MPSSVKAASTGTPTKVTATDLLDMLRRHHGLTGPAQEWAGGTLVPEVSPNGPATDTRRADAVYIGYTAASGRCLIGYEIKTSRSDWRREIARAASKADQWADQCHEWWIVVSDPAIVKDGELPQGWGLMSPPGGTDHRMTVHVRAHRKIDHTPSWDALRSIMARLETLRASTVKQQLWQIEIDVRRQVQAELNADFAKRCGPDAAELHRRIGLIEQALGVQFHWDDRCLFRGVNIADLARIAAAARQYGDISAAAQAITAPTRVTIGSILAGLDHLQRELDELQNIVTPQLPARNETA